MRMHNRGSMSLHGACACALRARRRPRCRRLHAPRIISGRIYCTTWGKCNHDSNHFTVMSKLQASKLASMHACMHAYPPASIAWVLAQAAVFVTSSVSELANQCQRRRRQQHPAITHRQRRPVMGVPVESCTRVANDWH